MTFVDLQQRQHGTKKGVKLTRVSLAVVISWLEFEKLNR